MRKIKPILADFVSESIGIGLGKREATTDEHGFTQIELTKKLLRPFSSV